MLPLLLPGLVLAWRLWLGWTYGSQIYTSVDDVPSRQVAIIFGAGILRNNRPTPALADRVEAAAALYHAGKAQKLLMTGDNRFVDYNEPEVMRRYAQELGVPAEAIVLDYAGRRTYDSCYRARAIFQVEEAILVTQKFHQARAAYLCRQLGVQPVGFVADNRAYRRRVHLWWNMRETLASSIAWWDVNVSRPVPVLGEILPIGE
jgi:SanA protein